MSCRRPKRTRWGVLGGFGDRWLARLRLGQQDCLDQIGKPLEEQELVRLLDARGNLVALIGWNEENPGVGWQLLRVFKE